MSTAATAIDQMLAQNAQLVRENAELRRRAPPLPPRLDELRNGQHVTDQQLVALRAEQRRGQFASGLLREVVTVDRTGRQSSHFFGDPGACWDQFKTPAKAVRGFNV
jgi:hypothetical protein